MCSVLPAFVQKRAVVMKEVQLGVLIGTGSTGRCHRGMWQVRFGASCVQAGRQAGSQAWAG
jgi:hypothetical protein